MLENKSAGIMNIFSRYARADNSSCLEIEAEEDVDETSKCLATDGCWNVLLLIIGCYLILRNYRLTPSLPAKGNKTLDDVKRLFLQVRDSHLNCRTELVALAELLKHDELANKVILDHLNDQIQSLNTRLEDSEARSESIVSRLRGPLSDQLSVHTEARSEKSIGSKHTGSIRSLNASAEHEETGSEKSVGGSKHTGSMRSLDARSQHLEARSKKSIGSKQTGSMRSLNARSQHTDARSQKSLGSKQTGSMQSLNARSQLTEERSEKSVGSKRLGPAQEGSNTENEMESQKSTKGSLSSKVASEAEVHSETEQQSVKSERSAESLSSKADQDDN